MDTKTVEDHLICRMDSFTNLILTNVIPIRYPWEIDVMKVTKTGYFYEYEIKVSIDDFRADLRKKHHRYVEELGKYRRKHTTKHEFLAGEEICLRPQYRSGTPALFVPRPRQFYFVAPADLIPLEKIPDHAGLIEIEDRGDRGVRQVESIKAPILNATKLSWKSLFNLSLKAGRKGR